MGGVEKFIRDPKGAWDDAWDSVEDVWDSIEDAWDDAWDWFKDDVWGPIHRAWDRNVWEHVKPYARDAYDELFDLIDKAAGVLSFGNKDIKNMLKRTFAAPLAASAYILAPSQLYNFDRDLFNLTRIGYAAAIAFVSTGGNPFFAAFAALTETYAVWQDSRARKEAQKALEHMQKLQEAMASARAARDAMEVEAWGGLAYFEALPARALYHNHLITGWDDPMTRLGFEAPDRRIDYEVETIFGDPYGSMAGNRWIDEQIPAIGTVFSSNLAKKAPSRR